MAVRRHHDKERVGKDWPRIIKNLRGGEKKAQGRGEVKKAWRREVRAEMDGFPKPSGPYPYTLPVNTARFHLLIDTNASLRFSTD